MLIKPQVSPSNLADSFLPRHVQESYQTFVDFMTTAAQSNERQGFGTDLLHNLLEYQDYDTYKAPIVTDDVLRIRIDADSEVLELESTDGFPDEYGVILIDDEIIYYDRKVGLRLEGLHRGASGTVILPTLSTPGKYEDTEAAPHNKGVSVYNLSILFVTSLLDSIHKTVTPGLSAGQISNEVNRATILKNIKDFYRAKGTELGIEALFKMVFNENDVEVTYPGDRMLKPSTSTWIETKYLRVLPIPEAALGNVKFDRIIDPDSIFAEIMFLKSYNDDKIYGQCVVDYEKRYGRLGEMQYELRINSESTVGNFFANPSSVLKRNVYTPGTTLTDLDVSTVTVECTLGFPDHGFIFIGDEQIYYEEKSLTQFKKCIRGRSGQPQNHYKGDVVMGPYFVEVKREEDDEISLSRSFPLGLVSSIDIIEAGLLHQSSDFLELGDAGEIDFREESLGVFIENLDYELASSNDFILDGVGNITYGVNGIYFDDRGIFVNSSGLPDYAIGPFSDDASVGRQVKEIEQMHVLPRFGTIQQSQDVKNKGSDCIGVFANGVPAFSNQDEDKFYHGDITKFKVERQGSGYKNPYVLIEPNNSTAVAIVSDGKIVGVSKLSAGFYTDIPTVRVTAGEGAILEPVFDRYGRITSVNILDGGVWYRDPPHIVVNDPTRKGRGASFLAETNAVTGEITKITVLSTGIDYDTTQSSLAAEAIGHGAIITAGVEYFTKDRVYQLENDRHRHFDSGNGYLFEEGDTGVLSRYGYMVNPKILRSQMKDFGGVHSPIIGYAYDGCPIYGPYGYANGITEDAGIALIKSSYDLALDRDDVIPGGYDIGDSATNPNPPSKFTYPMGTFVEDYVYTLRQSEDSFLTDELDNIINTEYDEDIVATTEIIRLDPLYTDRYGGRLCNTPEFPRDLYPEGVYCYFISVDVADDPVYPYIIGPTFGRRPISQNVYINDKENSEFYRYQNFEPIDTYDNSIVRFNLDQIDRYRNKDLVATKDDVSLRINQLYGGEISNVYIKDGGLSNNKIKDVIYFDESQTIGTGASAYVTAIEGEDVIASQGYVIRARHISHIITFDLSANRYESYVFTVGSQVVFHSGSRGIVADYLQDVTGLKTLTVSINTPELPESNDCFYDNKRQMICITGYSNYQSEMIIPPDATVEIEDSDDAFTTIDGLNIVLEQENRAVAVANPNIIVSPVIPESMPDAKAVGDGDIWWSNDTGKMYIRHNGDWVVSQPIGIRPFSTAIDEPSMGNTNFAPDITYSPGTVATVTISERAPKNRFDGQPNSMGDMWWSPHTGVLYIYYSYFIYDVNGLASSLQGGDGTFNNSTRQFFTGDWVPTDPSGMKPFGDTSFDEIWPLPSNLKESDEADPAQRITTNRFLLYVGEYEPVGLVPEACMWWCSRNGKLYIRYIGNWVVTNPHGWLSSQWSADEIIMGDGTIGGGSLAGQDKQKRIKDYIFFDDLQYFEGGDDVLFDNGITGTVIDKVYNAPGTDQSRFTTKLGEDSLFITRDRGDIPNRMMMSNTTRYLYSVETDQPHRLKDGDFIEIVETRNKDLYGVYQVIRSFQENTTDGLSSTNFLFYTIGKQFLPDPTLKYIATGENCMGKIAKVKMIARGIGYDTIPSIPGVRRRDLDECTTMVRMQGDQISSVDILHPGTRYANPIGIIEDLSGSGQGAIVDVKSNTDNVTSIDVLRTGRNYKEPICRIVETGSHMLALTNDIGRIDSVEIMQAGRNISPNVSHRPEIVIDRRMVVDADGDFTIGSEVYQGTTTHRLAHGRVKGWDNVRQMIQVEEMYGDFLPNRVLHSDDGVDATILVNDFVLMHPKVNGISSDVGSFVDMSGQLYSAQNQGYAVMQDSYFYQHFSYLISSPLQMNAFKNYTDAITHPAGFIMFSETLISVTVETDVTSEDSVLIISPDLTGVDLLVEQSDQSLIIDVATNEYTLQINN